MTAAPDGGSWLHLGFAPEGARWVGYRPRMHWKEGIWAAASAALSWMA
jgi:hypothetical protein